MCLYSCRYHEKCQETQYFACTALLNKINITTNAQAALSLLSTSAPCMQTKKVLKIANGNVAYYGNVGGGAKKSKPGIFYVVYKCVFHITSITLTFSNLNIWNLSQSQCVCGPLD